MPHRQGPQIGKVLRFNTGAGENSYSARVRILKSGSLEETERILEEVPYSPIWAGSNGAGVYAPLPENTLVVVGYIELDPSHPYIQGMWGEFYKAADFETGEFLITNGAMSMKMKANELLLNGDSLGGLIKAGELITNLQKNEFFLKAIQGAINGAASPGALLGLLKPFAQLSLGDFSNISSFENQRVKHG